MAKAIKRLVRAWVARVFGYEVRVWCGPFNGTLHYALTYREALQWAACYAPQHRLCITISDWIGNLIGSVR